MTSRRVLIVGDLHHLGGHLARRCALHGHEVHVLAPANGVELAMAASGVATHVAPADDLSAVLACFDRVVPDYVFDCTDGAGGWHDRVDAAQVLAGTGIRQLMILIRAAGLCRQPPSVFIRTGSIAEYGVGPLPFREDQREQPVTAAGLELVAKTQLATMIATSVPFRLATARLAHVYGGCRDTDSPVAALVDGAIGGKPVGDRNPRDRYDLLHHQDATTAIFRLAEEPPACGAIINIGSDTSIAMDELGAAITRITGCELRWSRDGHPEPIEQRMSIERIVAGWGWVPRVSLARGLADIVAARRETVFTVAA